MPDRNPALKPQQRPEYKDATEEATARLVDCRRQKERASLDVREAYFFTRPRLHRHLRSDGTPDENKTRPNDEHELATGIGTEVNEDFATEVINGFFKRGAKWAESSRGFGVEDELWELVEEQVKKIDDQVFDEIRASNFEAEIGSAFVPDIGVGTVALNIDEGPAGGAEPILVQHVPLRELEINIGPYGTVDDRFAVRFIRWRDIPSVIPAALIDAKMKEHMKNNAADWVQVSWGYWRDWGEPADELWRHVILVNNVVIHTKDYRGRGSCPLLVMRFAPDALHSFGNGPTIDALPALRVLDMLTKSQHNRASQSLDPSFTYPDDGILNFEGGIEDGKAYPRRPGGTRDDIIPLYFQGDVNLGILTLEDLERAIRRKHFSDFPQQPGKTPPTATQWIDQMVLSQRRIGTPGLKFWLEGPAQVFQRFKYLGQQRKTVDELAAGQFPITTVPSNPATRAQENQEVQTAVRFLEIAGAFFPEVLPAVVDPITTLNNIKEKLGDEIVELRDQQQFEQMAQMLLSQAAAGGVEGEEGAAAAGALTAA